MRKLNCHNDIDFSDIHKLIKVYGLSERKTYSWNNKQTSCKDRFSNFKTLKFPNFTAGASEIQDIRWITITSEYRLIFYKK